MSHPAGQAPPDARRNALILGVAQTLAWSVTYYLPAVVAPVVVADLGPTRRWSMAPSPWRC